MIDTNKGIIAWFARNSVAANLLMAIILLAGIATTFTIKKQMFPEISVDVVNVRVAYLGAAPQEVEEGIIDKVEEVLENIDGIKKVTSTSVEGLGTVRVEVDDDYDVQEILDEVKTQVDSISSFPEQTEKPVVYRTKITSNVMWLAVYGDLTERGLKVFANDIRDEIKAMPGISKVDVVGERDYEIAIEVTEQTLRKYNLTFEQVVNAVRNSSIDVPGGSIKSENGDILLRAKGQAYNAQEFEEIVLVTRADGTRLTLADIATVKDGFEEVENLSLFNGKPVVNIRINAVGEEDTLQIAETVKRYVEQKKADLPSSVNIDHWGDSSFYLQGRLDLMMNNMLLGGLLVLLALALFLELKVAFWVVIGIPVCFLGTIALMPLEMFDVSINVISLFGFILVLGIVVDDAIIIGESAYSEIEKKGLSTDSVIAGTKRVAMPATFGVLTTIAAFTPMVMVSGPQGAIWEAIALVVMLSLAFSLVESKLILPAHLAHMRLKQTNKTDKPSFGKRLRTGVATKLKTFVETKYRPFLVKSIQYRYTTLATFVGVFVLVIGMIAGGFVRFVMFPNIPSDFVEGNITMMEGTSEESTNAAIIKLQDALLEMDKDFEKEFGEPVVKHYLAFNQSATSGEMVVELKKGEDREIDGFEIVRRWREKVPEIPGLKNLTFNAGINNGGGADVSFRLQGKSLPVLRQAAEELKEKLATYEGINDINDSVSGGNDELILKVKPEAEALGLSLASIARQVRYGFYGAEAQRVQRDGEEIKVMVRYPREERSSISNLESMMIRTANGDEVPFSTVAEFEMQPSYSTITRIDGQRSITVSAAADKDKIEPGSVVREINAEFLPQLTEKYAGVSTALEGQSKDEQDSIIQLAKAALLALFMIYALMAIPLKSYSQPLIIMSVIPFGLIGALVGHLLLGLSMSMLSMFGIIALAGVVVNDSLIMVDFVNKGRAAGMSIRDAAVEAGTQRFRAIILTSLTTFFGLTPIVFEKSLQAQIVIPMAVSLAFGIVFATVITLVLIPSLYIILDDFKGLFRNKKPKQNEALSSTDGSTEGNIGAMQTEQ
ncbi:efflux RND transporter permease subunit [Flocculibacter collagenilyticus]|uniref:efflux RND transporter permease subunit n=1 Tax=Flocculibacter collagenilyticus TaxID=2744479 RepID=UPI0018F7AA87|nr:efflux RND transporter permease subunit [Flocculibacter collagenilyticus]